MLDAVQRFRRTSQPCLLLVHPSLQRLEGVVSELISSYDWPHLSVGRELSAKLLPEMPQRRSWIAGRWMKGRVGDLAPGPVLCTEIDLLFEPALSLDPLRLFRDVGRLTRLVVTWPGTYQGDVLAYAVPDHARYRTWRRPEAYVVGVD